MIPKPTAVSATPRNTFPIAALPIRTVGKYFFI
jgi:hypothetical protein